VNDFSKKILPYLDGLLSSEEKSEFEAYVRTHPDFEEKIKSKKDETEYLRNLIPEIELSSRTRASLHSEIKASVFNLLRQEPKSFVEDVKDRFEEWLNR